MNTYILLLSILIITQQCVHASLIDAFCSALCCFGRYETEEELASLQTSEHVIDKEEVEEQQLRLLPSGTKSKYRNKHIKYKKRSWASRPYRSSPLQNVRVPDHGELEGIEELGIRSFTNPLDAGVHNVKISASQKQDRLHQSKHGKYGALARSNSLKRLSFKYLQKKNAGAKSEIPII